MSPDPSLCLSVPVCVHILRGDVWETGQHVTDPVCLCLCVCVCVCVWVHLNRSKQPWLLSVSAGLFTVCFTNETAVSYKSKQSLKCLDLIKIRWREIYNEPGLGNHQLRQNILTDFGYHYMVTWHNCCLFLVGNNITI